MVMMGWHDVMIGSVLMATLAVLAFLAVITAVAVIAWRSSGGSSAGTEQSEARRLLDERLARGQIDIEEYRRTAELLHRSR
jgi:putative membrane protein